MEKDEIAGLTRRADLIVDYLRSGKMLFREALSDLTAELTAALRAQAQEIERLDQGWKDANYQALDRGLKATERIRELEAITDEMVERAAKALVEAFSIELLDPKDVARVALEAASGANHEYPPPI